MKTANEIDAEAQQLEERAQKLRELAQSQRNIERLARELGVAPEPAKMRKYKRNGPTVLGAMKHGYSYTVTTLADVTGLARSRVNTALYTLEKNGKVERLQEGRNNGHPEGGRPAVWARTEQKVEIQLAAAE